MTYSIVARDDATGELGVAVQTRWFNVGETVPWAEAGVGAVATQSFSEKSYGPLGVARMREGASAPQTLAALLASDPDREVRQVGMVDAKGRSGAFTGSRCVAAAGHLTADDVSIQANMMERSTVWPAMGEAFRSTAGPLADRLMAALCAAEAEGGDVRGRQSPRRARPPPPSRAGLRGIRSLGSPGEGRRPDVGSRGDGDSSRPRARRRPDHALDGDDACRCRPHPRSAPPACGGAGRRASRLRAPPAVPGGR